MTKLQEFVEGWKVIGLLAKVACSSKPRVTATSPSGAFYPLGWWWDGEHILVPQLIEEERIAAELEKTFGAEGEIFIWGDGIKVRTGTSVKVGRAEISYSGPAIPVVTRPSGQVVGYWMWESVKIETTSPLHPIRQWLLKILTGVRYSPATPKAPSASTKSSSPTPLSVLMSYLDLAPTPPTPTSSE